jgi:hypothetical protein
MFKNVTDAPFAPASRRREVGIVVESAVARTCAFTPRELVNHRSYGIVLHGTQILMSF